ncbi:unnamed protein product, partial [Aphanomyces euteiches]
MLKEELLTLQLEKEKLESLLAMLHAKHESKSVWLSDKQQKWQRIAQKQLELKLKAEREHEELSAMLEEQSVMKREMEAILFKKLRLMMKKLQDENWRSLNAQSERRLLDIHAIADRQLESIDSDMLSLGLLESTETIESVRHNLSTNFSEGIVCTKFQAASFSHIETAIWKAILFMHSASPLQHFIIRHPLDENTIFVRLKYAIPNCKVKVESALILKRQQVGPRTVRMILRSIANDEADPFEPDSFVCDHCAWFHIEEMDDASYLYKSFVRGNFSGFKPDDVMNLSSMFDGIVLENPWKKTPIPKDSITISTTLFESTFQTFQTTLLSELAKQ